MIHFSVKIASSHLHGSLRSPYLRSISPQPCTNSCVPLSIWTCHCALSHPEWDFSPFFYTDPKILHQARQVVGTQMIAEYQSLS